MTRSLFFATALLATPAAAESCISTELVLMADISSSMTKKEKEIQRGGYAAAFRSGDVLDAILGSYCGAIAVQYVEFGQETFVVSDWQIVATDEDAEAFALSLEEAPPIETPPGGFLTGLARAIQFAGESLANNGLDADSQVIDVSADGGDNTTGTCNAASVSDERDALTTPTAENGWREVTINALPIIGGGQYVGTCGLGLSDYMEQFVQGGPRSFLIEANGVSDLPKIVRQKLAREIG